MANGIVLEKSFLNVLPGLGSIINFQFVTVGGEFTLNACKVGGEGKCLTGFSQGKVQIFRKPVQAMEDAQTGPALKTSLFEKIGSPQGGKDNFLRDFPQGLLLFE